MMGIFKEIKKGYYTFGLVRKSFGITPPLKKELLQIFHLNNACQNRNQYN